MRLVGQVIDRIWYLLLIHIDQNSIHKRWESKSDEDESNFYRLHKNKKKTLHQ